MAGQSVPIMCYWGGKMYYGQKGVCYDINPESSIRLKRGTSYSQLLDQMYAVMKLDKTEVRLKMTCRFPMNQSNYVPLKIVDDESVETMREVVLENPGLYSVELYMETGNVQRSTSVSQPTSVLNKRLFCSELD